MVQAMNELVEKWRAELSHQMSFLSANGEFDEFDKEHFRETIEQMFEEFLEGSVDASHEGLAVKERAEY